jgi:hypothetical protein
MAKEESAVARNCKCRSFAAAQDDILNEFLRSLFSRLSIADYFLPGFSIDHRLSPIDH